MANVEINDKTREIIVADFSALSNADMNIITIYQNQGYTARPKRKTVSGHDKDYYRRELADKPEELKKFNAILEKSFLAAKAYATNILTLEGEDLETYKANYDADPKAANAVATKAKKKAKAKA